MRDPLILSDPDAVIEKYYFKAAKFYFDDKKLWSLASRAVSMEVSTLLTRAINGGTIHLAKRHEWSIHYKKIIDAK
jgi:hypothetical protein